MAVIPGLPGIEIYISVAGNRLPESIKAEDPERQNGNEFRESKLLESVVPGQEFAICLTVKNSFKFQDERLGFKIFVDGVRRASPSIRKEKLTCDDWVHKVEGTHEVDWTHGNKKLKNFTFRNTGINGQEGKIEVHIFGIPAVQGHQMKLNPLGGLVIAYISANHSNEWKGDSRMPEELQKLQTAIPTLPLDYMYPFMADVEIDQLIQYLRGLVGQNCGSCKLASQSSDGNTNICPSTPVKTKLEFNIQDQCSLLPTPPSTTTCLSKRQRDSEIEESPSKKSKLLQNIMDVVDLTSDIAESSEAGI